MNYRQTIEWLYGLEAKRGMDFRIERLHRVLSELDHPERHVDAIQIVGTNGKGSTAAMLHAVYRAAGYRVGLYTSPHLESFRERIVVGGRRITREAVVEHVERVRRAAMRAGVALTFFEITTLVALLEFRSARVHLAVMEAGLGGRLDATSVVRPIAVALTSVGRDHEAFLGNSLAEIAMEKVAVARAGTPLVTGKLPPEAARVVASHARRERVPWLHYGRDFGPCEAVRPGALGPGLHGAHQRINAGVAVAIVGALEELYPVEPRVRDWALAHVHWPGRLEAFGGAPVVVADAAHNPEAARALRNWVSETVHRRPLVLVFGVLADKDWQEMLCALAPVCDHVVVVPVASRRSLDPARLAALAQGLRPTTLARSAAEGLERAVAMAGPEGVVLVTGSIFLVGELYQELRALGRTSDAQRL